jgi:hypothetical protein
MERAAEKTGFFQKRLPSQIILWSFLLLTLPLAATQTFSTDHRFVFFYIWLFGLTHFVLTLSIYLQSENLKHFAESKTNIILFFVVPLVILMGFYVVGILQLRAKFPVFAVVFAAAIRLLDFNHLNRQTFGVYQLFKSRAGIRPLPALKRAEQGFLATLTALLFTTYLAGGVFPLLPGSAAHTADAASGKLGQAILPIGLLKTACLALIVIAALLAAISLALALRAWRKAGRPAGMSQGLTYLGFQTVGVVFAVVSMPLYFATLAIHYVEYHVLMFPRWFHTRLDEKSLLDRCFARLRRRPSIFYGFVVLSALVVWVFTKSSGMADLSTRYLVVVSIFDGLFVFHYFVEMLIWRFSDPFFRRTLAPLYFAPRG